MPAANKILRQREIDLAEPLTGIKTMLELGDKKWSNRPPYKAYFESIGIRHVSVDINGRNGSVKKDLRKPLNLGRFDCVTNWGTTEHVTEQEPVWRNICEACTKLFVSITPKPHTFPTHGLLYPTEEFYRELARLNGFVVERMYDFVKRKGTLLCVRMVRESDVPFVMPDESLIFRNAEYDRYSEEVAREAKAC